VAHPRALRSKRRCAVARGFQKSGREKRTPTKAEKPKPPAQTSPFERGPGVGIRRGAKKKHR
jgi:hypothetical protein